MRTIAIILLLALAGCTDPDAVQDTAAPTPDIADDQNETAQPTPLVLRVDVQEIVLQGEDAVAFNYSVGGDATVTITQDGETVYTGNPSTGFSGPVDVGHTTFNITADDGIATQSAEILVKRYMALTVEIDHDPAQGKQDRSDMIYWDFGGLRSLHEDESYQGCEQPHPERPNAHDALLDYVDATGVTIDFSDCGSFGVSPSNVDGIDYGPLGWCFEVNGETAEFGISLLELADGDVFRFINCAGLSA